MSARTALIVMAKLPRAGHVKTRMCPPLSLEEAADLYAAMLDDVLAASGRIARELELEAVLAIQPGAGAGDILSRVPRRFRVIAQRGANLAQRMGGVIADVAAGGVERLLLRGSDSPALDPERIRDARDALGDCDLVLCPDLDGGYNLVGLRRPVPGLFDHPMSTRSVLEDTLASARERGLRARLLEPAFDLDTAADFAHLERVRSHGRARDCPRTLAFLDARDLWQRSTSGIGCCP